MRGVILGTDLLEINGDVKILETNTNTTIYSDGASFLDYDVLFNTLNSLNITEFHFIFNELDSYTPINGPFVFKQKLQEKCVENNISFNEYPVPTNSVTVPFIEDAPNKFILRQSYDTTALIDDTYCADKFGFFSLMSGSTYVPNTYFVSSNGNVDTLTNVDYQSQNPNAIIKSRIPNYDLSLYPEIHVLSNSSQLNDLKTNLPEDYLIQEFIFSNDNLVDGKYAITRSIDIVYGSNLDVINLGGYKQSTVVPLNFFNNEFIEGTTILNRKSRHRFITKEVGIKEKHPVSNYHTDEDSVILDYTGSLKDVNTIQIGDYIRSIDFVDFNDNHAANFEEGKIDVLGWDSTLVKSNQTLTQVSSSLQTIKSASIDTIYIRVTTADGKSWVDSPSCTYYIEESGSLSTRFEKLNQMYVGDKMVITDSNTQELTTLEITNLQMEYASMTIYGLDFEPSDLFLVDIGDGDFTVMHNDCWCPWSFCGNYCYVNNCGGCGAPPPKL